ncbi:MAG: hypothetical protein Kow0092_15550 [Deferrisomatales bacterium]
MAAGRDLIAGLLLAAGASTRMGGPNKLLLPVGGTPLVRRAAETLLAAGLAPVVVVLGRDAARVAEALDGLAVTSVENPEFAHGMAGSLRRGVEALGPEVGAVAVALADLPALRPETVRAVCRAFRASPRGVAVPVWRGRRGHPAVFDLARYRVALAAVEGDRGARGVLEAHPEDVLQVPVEDPGICVDVDTPADWAALEGQGR